MLEALLAVTATTGLFALAKGWRGARHQRADGLLPTIGEDRGEDLPCPWCYGPTQEGDTRCPGCGRPFGPVQARRAGAG